MGNCRLCRRFIISQAVTFAAGTLTINIPAGSYNDMHTYCLLIAQPIPAETTITAPVVITIGTGAVTYPLNNRCCAQVIASALRERTVYPVVVATSAVGGSFKLLCDPCCAPDNRLAAIDGTDAAAAAVAGGDGA